MGIVIQWHDAREYIAVDLNGLKGHPHIEKTREVRDDGTVADYKTTSKFEHLGSGSWRLELQYDRSQNMAVADGATFGISTITLKAGDTNGKAVWADDTDSYNDGIRHWQALDTTIFKSKKIVQKQISTIERKQQVFRNLLKVIYRECAISGERTLSALEAAHVVPSRRGGAETIANGLLLRADLHRLFDACEFGIDSTGDIILPPNSVLSNEYQKLLAGKVIPDEVFKFVKRAFADKSANRVRT